MIWTSDEHTWERHGRKRAGYAFPFAEGLRRLVTPLSRGKHMDVVYAALAEDYQLPEDGIPLFVHAAPSYGTVNLWVAEMGPGQDFGAPVAPVWARRREGEE